ncbi:extracellular solute-binding protein [Eisenbergiella tayi]|uniref:extracellular solute-binding protein n=1 Tax=Eisenbergiella tayi TaxID=1432052 RepID=UPI0022DEC57F|nr:extracellular solute-binding protein [Eisenbergiella tayi]
MRKNGKRILAMLLAAVMTASLAGCEKGGETAAGTAENDNGGQEAAGQDEVVTLKMFIRNQSKYTGLQEDPVAKYIEEKLGIRIELTVDSSLGNTTAQTSTFNELLATKLASNDLDDIMDFGSPSGNPEILNNLNRAVEAGMIIPLDDLVAEYTENLSTDPRLTIRNDYRREHMYNDGKFYSVGGWGGMGLDQLPGAANWVRWDLYKEMGYPDVETDEDYLEMLKEMQDSYPETPGGEKVYAIGGAFADPQGMGDGFVNRDYPLSKGYEPLEGNYAVYLNHATKQVEAPLQDPDSFFWNGVKLYYKANQMGILDPGAVTMSSAEYTEKINKGAYLSAVNGWQVMNKEAILDGLGMKDAGYMPMRPLEDVVSLSVYWESVVGGNEFAITSKCKYPEKAIQFLDWCMSEEGSRMITQGAEGMAYTMDGDVRSVTQQYLDDNAGGTVDMAETYGKWKYAGINAFQHIDVDSNGYYIQPEQIPNVDNYSAVKKDALSFYGTESFTDYFTQYKNRAGEKLPNVIWSTYTSGIGSKPDDIKQKYAQINEYMYKQIFKMIYAKDDAEYEALQNEAMEKVGELGVRDVVKWYQDRFAQLHTDLDPLIDQAMKAYGVE